jgi:alkylation response protein AidB-like acyl-CoA dehydrogenase
MATATTATADPQVSFEVTEEQELLRATVRDLLATRAGSARVREVMLGDDGLDLDLWAELAGLGLLGLTIPEEHGGAGASFVEVAVVAEELGRTLAPVPYLSSAVLGTTALLHGAGDHQRATHLPAVASGETRLALAHLDDRGRLTADPGVRAARDGDGWVLDGTAGYVVDGRTADLVVTAAVTDDGIQLFLVAGGADGLTRTDVEVLDLTRPMATLAYDGVRVDDTARLTGGDPVIALHEALTAGVVAIACEQVGGARAVLASTTAYARDRVQFGRAIGSFQAVKHRLAEMLGQVESARSAAAHAARVVASGDLQERAIAAPLAASYCAEVYEQATGDSIQLFGGIGFTWEHDAHLYFKRAKATKLLLGDPKHHRALLAEALGV